MMKITFSKNIKACLVLSMLFFGSICIPQKAWAQTISGSGTSGDPYLITSSADLNSFRTYVESNNSTYVAPNKYWKVTTNITWDTPDRIGYTAHPFYGFFDGGGYTITFSSISHPTVDEVGFFGQTQDATIRNLTLSYNSIDGRDHTGGLVGQVRGNTLIENVQIRANNAESCCTSYGNGWGGLVGHIYDLPNAKVTIKTCSVVITSVQLNCTSNYDAGGLVGKIDGWSGSVEITDCLAVMNFLAKTNFSIGGLIGCVISGTPVTMTRCYTPTTVPNLGSTYWRGSIVGAVSGGASLTCNAVHTGITSTLAGYTTGGTFKAPNSQQINDWINNSAVFDWLERQSSTGTTLASNVRGNETWGYDVFVHPMIAAAKTQYAYAVKVARGTTNLNIAGHRYASSNFFYTNANEELTISFATTPGVTQRVEYNFKPDYDHSTGAVNNYVAKIENNNCKLLARVNGEVTAKMIDIPHPVSLQAQFNQWDKNVTLSWNYDNESNLTGKFFVYQRETSPTPTPWSVIFVTGQSVQNGSKITMQQTNPSDYSKTYEYCVAFVETTDNAPNSPDDTNPYLRETVSLSTAPTLSKWDVTATGGENSITISFNTSKYFTNSSEYTYAIERSINGSAFAGWITNQYFNAKDEYENTDNDPTSSCDVYIYRVVISAFGTTFSQESNESRIEGVLKFAATDPFKVTKGEYANYVRLQWKMNKLAGGATETYRVFRRIANTNTEFIELETITSNAATVYWNDNNALTGIFYEYKITPYQICQGVGETELESKTDIGFTQAFGTVLGRVTYGTGNAVEGVSMLVKRNELQEEKSQYYSLKSTGGGEKFEWLTDSVYFNNTIWNLKQWTLQFWVNPNGINTGNSVIGYLGTYPINLTAVTDGYQISTELNNAYHSETIPSNHFSQIIITRNDNDVKIYTICDQNPDNIYIQHTSFIFTTATPQTSANSKISFGHNLKGNIDEVRLWNRTLNETEIMRDYSRCLVGNESGLKGYWNFDEALPGYAFDKSRTGTVYNGNHATTNTLTYDDNLPDEVYQLALKGITDANGNYQISGIPFMGEGTSYSIVPSLGIHQFNPTEQLRYISPTSMVHNSTDFIDISAFIVSGKIIYEGGTYPVTDCSFEIDDKTVTQSNGKVVKSGYDGTFNISVPIGIHKVRAVKQGHTFAHNGLLIDENTGENLNYNAPLNNIIFYDQTRVKFIGRVVGGAIENEKPLGFGESHNNIGLKTITLESTRQQYEFSTSPVSETYTHNQEQWKKPDGLIEDTTTVDYDKNKITIHASSVTGEFVAMVYPESYNIDVIRVPGAGGVQLTVYSNNEMIDLTASAVPEKSFMRTSIRTWTDSTYVINQPGVVDHWEYTNKSDTVYYNADWKYYYQATPTFGVKQFINKQLLDYFGEKEYILKDDLAGTTDTLDLWSQTNGYLFGKPVFRQGMRYTFHLNAYEEYTNYVSDKTVQYPVTDGKVNMMNTIKLSSEPETINMDENGEADYGFMAGAPNLTTATNNFFATLSLGAISYYWDMPLELAPSHSDPVVAWHLGDKSTGTDFMTAGPNQLTAILRDPPGNQSSSFIEQGTTITSKNTLSSGIGVNLNLNLKTSLGPKLVTFAGIGAGVITEEETKIDISAGLKTETKFTAGLETVQTSTFTERFETSDDPAYVGHYGDVFIGNSTNLLYGLTNAVNIQKNYENEFNDGGEPFITKGNYSIAPAVSLAYGQSFDTRFVFTEIDIVQIMIPKWKNALSILLHPVGTQINTSSITSPVYVSQLPQSDPDFGKLNTDPVFGSAASTPEHFDDGPSYKIYYPDIYDMTEFTIDSVMFYNNQINGWIATLAQNEKEKVEMEKIGNYSFGGGVSIQYSKTATASQSTTYTFSTVINPTIGLVTGGEVMGIGLELETSMELVAELETSTGTTEETSVTSGFTLKQDGYNGDQLTVDYGMTASGTIAFKTRGGRTSCPYEGEVVTQYYQPGNFVLDEATMQIEVPKISVLSAPQMINVLSNHTAAFTLALQNESEIGADLLYELVVDENTNPYGAELKIDGTPIGNGRLFFCQAGQTLQKTLTVGKGSADIYQNIALILRSLCQNEIADTTYVSVEFIPACSDVAIIDPKQNWILNADSQTGDTLNVTISNYDVNFPNFGYIKLEYRPISSPNWSTIMTFYPSALYPNAQGVKEDIGIRPIIVYPWKTPEADGAYELRASTASVNIVNNFIVGDPLSTYTTDAVTGYKDVHRPTSLGAPSPASGILGIGDELSITFNKDIQTGMLTQNNFTISGILNAQEIAEPNVGLAFTGGSQSAFTELPIYTSGSFSIETWFQRDINAAGTLFAFGSNNNYISLGFNVSGNAILKIGSETYTSVTPIVNDNTWKYIAMAYNRDNNTVSVYEFEGATNNILFTAQALIAAPETQGKLTVGNNALLNDGVNGAIAQLHFYGIKREQASVSADKSLTKSGSEYGLIGYWLLDEGEGTIAKDKARARNLTLNTDWYIYPSGYAKQTNNTYFSIPTSTYPLNAFCDFTLEFWFRSENTNQPNQTLFCADNGSIEINATGGLTLYKNDGTVNQLLTTTNVTDTKWHHIALSVKRSGSVKVYIDGENKAVFAESQLGSFASGNYYFGAKRTPPNTFTQYFAGYFDEVRIWNSALTLENVLLNKNNKLRGDEPGLQAYYPFETYTKQPNGLITVTPTDKNMTDSFTVEGTATGFSTIAMSVKDVRPVENVPYTYVASNNKIVFTLDNNYFARVEKTTLTITVNDIWDMHNNKSNTEQWTAYVNRNPLRWDADPVNIKMEEGETRIFTARIVNVGGTTVSYAIENLPSWLSVNYSAGNLQPLASRDLTFTIFEGTNIGNYETALGLTCGNGVTEILPVQLKVTGVRPDWEVNPSNFEFSMNITGQIKIEDVFQEDPDDLLGAFIGDLCVGVTSPIYVNTNNAYFTFADIYGNDEHNNQLLKFKIWDASTGRIYPVVETSISEIRFTPSQILGSTVNPVIFNALGYAEQIIPLKKGWTWISANVLNDNPSIINQMKTSLTDVGVIIKGRTGYIQQPGWVGMLNSISAESMYVVNTTENHSLTLTGVYADPATTPIAIEQGWNWVGYIPSFTLPVQNALAGMNAQVGDQIKGQVGYVTYTGTNWIGSLDFMQSGKGYMYYSTNATPQTLIYPSTPGRGYVMPDESNEDQEAPDYSLTLSRSHALTPHWSVDISNFPCSMTMTAIVFNSMDEIRSEFIEVGAFSGNECRGSAILQYVDKLDKYFCFLMIYGNGGETITLKVYDHETNKEYTANNAPITFMENQMFGDPANPYIVSIGAIVTLSNLTVSEGELTPAFNSDIFAYSVDVPYGVSSLTISATPTDMNATVAGDGVKTLDTGNNVFTITVTAQDAVTTLDYTVTVIRAVGINDPTQEPSEILVYPNPTTGELRITNYELRIDEIEIFDVYGRIVGAYPCGCPETVINISHFPSGVYFVRIITEQGSVMKRVIKN